MMRFSDGVSFNTSGPMRAERRYDGWYVFESAHTDHAQVVEATTKNIVFLRKHCRMPLG